MAAYASYSMNVANIDSTATFGTFFIRLIRMFSRHKIGINREFSREQLISIDYIMVTFDSSLSASLIK